MTTAAAPDRLRQIAILVSCVDAAAARQILLHLPTDKARRVRDLASRLGVVSADEKRRVLAEFQRTAAQSNATAPVHRSPASATGHDLSDELASGFASQTETTAAPSWDAQPATANSWTQLQPAALVRLVRYERPAVTAVVLSQLPPAVAAEVLQHLPPESSREVLLRLSRLEEIDPEAMQAIDEHLSQRLSEYQHHTASQTENARRIQMLLAAAPETVRQQWSALLDNEDGSSHAAADVASHAGAAAESTTATAVGATAQSGSTHPAGAAAAAAASAVGGTAPPANAEMAPLSVAPATGAGPDILPFPQPPSARRVNDFDRSLMQIEFEEILQLPAAVLAKLLSATDSQTVLLALAGASPHFMHRFLNMLHRRDARLLQERLQRIGPLRLRDIDEAQRQIVENAALLTRASPLPAASAHRAQAA